MTLQRARCVLRSGLAALLAAVPLAAAEAPPPEPANLSAEDRAAVRSAVEELLPGVEITRIAAPAGAPPAVDLDVTARAEVDLASHAREGRVERFRRLRCEARHTSRARPGGVVPGDGWLCSARSIRDWVRVAPAAGEAPCPEGSVFELPVHLSATEILDLVDYVQSGALAAALPEREPKLEGDEACDIAWIEPWPAGKYDVYTRRGDSLAAGRLFEVLRECGEGGGPCELSLVRAISWGAAVPSF